MSHDNSERDYKDPLRRYNPATSIILAGYRPKLSEYSVKVPLFRTSTFEFESADSLHTAENGDLFPGRFQQYRGDQTVCIFSKQDHFFLQIHLIDL